MTKDTKTERVSAMMTPDETEQIDRYFRTHRLKSRSEAVRRLVKLGLNAAAETRLEPVRSVA